MDIIDELAEWKCRAEEAIAAKERAERALALAVAECEAAKQLVDAHRTLNRCMNVENLHAVNQAAIAYDMARRARIATTTPESPDDSKEDA